MIMIIKKWLWLKLLPKLNDRHHPTGRIPRSGPAAKNVNCFSIYLNIKDDGSSLMLVDSIDKYRVIGRRLDMNQSFTIFDGFSTEKVINAEIEIWHHYGIHEFVYYNIYDYFMRSYLGWDRLRAISWNIKNAIAQWLFNLRRIDAGERYELLKFLVAKLSNRNFRVTDVMYIKHSRYIFNRRDYRDLSQETTTLLRFLVDTNDLKVSNNGEYSVTGHGWKTVSDYEETDRRVSAGNRVQWGLFVLSMAVVLLTAGQAGVIKFSTLWDFRSEIEKAAQEPKQPVTQINNYYQIEPGLKSLNNKNSSVQKK